MKKSKTIALATSLLLSQSALKADIPAELSGYTHYLELAPTDNTGASIIGSVGSWSWEDRDLGSNVFWRHRSDWIAFNLAEAASVTIQVERNNDERDSSKLFPSFTLYQSFNDTDGGSHFADNTSDLQWEAGSQLMSYLMHHENSSDGTIERTIDLAAGNYTVLLGGNAVAEPINVAVDYRAVFSASPIPEPSTALLGLLAALPALALRKR